MFFKKKERIKKYSFYTACFGKYDEKHSSADFYFDEDNNPYDGCADNLSDRLKAKLYKVINPLSYDVWIDSSIEFVNRKGFEELLSGDLCVLKHPFHKNLQEELDLCHKLGYVNEKQKKNIKFLYKSIGMKLIDTPVYSGGILYRTNKSKNFNDLWWRLICQYSYRDQLTLPYAINVMSKLKFNVIDLDVFNNEYFVVNNHKKKDE